MNCLISNSTYTVRYWMGKAFDGSIEPLLPELLCIEICELERWRDCRGLTPASTSESFHWTRPKAIFFSASMALILRAKALTRQSPRKTWKLQTIIRNRVDMGLSEKRTEINGRGIRWDRNVYKILRDILWVLPWNSRLANLRLKALWLCAPRRSKAVPFDSSTGFSAPYLKQKQN